MKDEFERIEDTRSSTRWLFGGGGGGGRGTQLNGRLIKKEQGLEMESLLNSIDEEGGFGFVIKVQPWI